MKIIAGTLHQRSLSIPKTFLTRPTSSKLRGQVFNICQTAIEGGAALDLFAGSGAMGIEALSRGASDCTFVEQDRQVTSALKANIKKLGLEKRAHILTMDAARAIHRLSSTPLPFSFVYIDPPYGYVDPLNDLLSEIETSLPLAPGAYVFLETKKGSFEPQAFSSLVLASHRVSGDSDLWHFEKSSS